MPPRTTKAQQEAERLARTEAEIEGLRRDVDDLAVAMRGITTVMSDVQAQLRSLPELAKDVGELADSVKEVNGWLNKGLGAKGLIVALVSGIVALSAVASMVKIVLEWFGKWN